MSTCSDTVNGRTVSDIVWSCLTTIFLCTWVAIHPNIPAPYESSLEIGLRRLGIVIMALIAPEIIILLAMRQWIASRRLAKEHHSEGWTQTHGFVALMGGFMLFNGDKALYTLSPKELDRLWRNGKIEFPKISKEDIEDKSKGDIISKGFVIIQTTWFVLQCIARGVEGLAITELELVTLAFAVLNLATYALWWNKPLNVQRSIPVRLSDEGHVSNQAIKEEEVHGMFNRAAQRIIELWSSQFWERILLPKSPSGAMTADGFTTGAKKVSSFYAGDRGHDVWNATLPSAAFAVIFGAVHCIGWSFEFPSHVHEILWRTCSLVITCMPVAMVSLVKLIHILLGIRDRRDDIAADVSEIFRNGVGVMAGIILPILYVVARMILLVESFLLLKSLPPGAFQTVQWTTFIPHV
ncbi:hypothetical protein BD410DRAFT_856986 [Rickenella mellea]|uniref:Uncharacterized protein n=1 Tax=Rickenella mellea TaxID=50990 RepID=A0A4Y7PKE9_9AGAM|nr:hypothetical protein BD410DRAFT_856986 [Rickenella mellea]